MANKEAEVTKPTLGEWLDNHPKSVFITRAVMWAIFAAGLPFAFIAWRYGIFKEQTAIALNGWGVLGIVILIVFFITLAGYIRKGIKPGYFKQCASGFCKVVLPLLAILLILEGIKSDIELFEKALCVTIVCELVAIPINPFPQWLEERRKEQNLEEQEGVAEVLWNKFFDKKKEEEKKGE